MYRRDPYVHFVDKRDIQWGGKMPPLLCVVRWSHAFEGRQDAATVCVNGNDSVILGASGCGVNGLPVMKVAL